MDNLSQGLLVLIRHGESLWNEIGLWTGWTDIPLSKKGEQEAEKAGQKLKNIHFDLFLSSPLKRSTKTSKIIINCLKIKPVKYQIAKEYKERNYGIYTGKNKWSIKKEIGETEFNNLRRGWNKTIPQGETLKDVYLRLIGHFKRVVLKNLKKGLNVAIVAHGNTHRAIIKYLEKIPSFKVANVEIATGEIVMYKINAKGEVVSKENILINTNKGKQ
jgi:2,3-bisphosphoglycerate-dependent phosphoglycerate mutase